MLGAWACGCGPGDERSTWNYRVETGRRLRVVERARHWGLENAVRGAPVTENGSTAGNLSNAPLTPRLVRRSVERGGSCLGGGGGQSGMSGWRFGPSCHDTAESVRWVGVRALAVEAITRFSRPVLRLIRGRNPTPRFGGTAGP